MQKIILVTGSRDWTDEKTIAKYMDFVSEKYKKMVLVHGNASGADKLCEKYALSKSWEVRKYPILPLEWKIQGKSAGPKRNQKMIDEETPSVGLVFWKNKSKGTKDCMNRLYKIIENLEEFHIINDS